jgi:hypothetical protein
MSGPEDTGEEPGTPAVPVSPAPPSFGVDPSAGATAGFSPFGLEKPWWAASEESAEPEASVNVARTDETDDADGADGMDEADEADEDDSDTIVFGADEATGPAEEVKRTAPKIEPSPGTLVAGFGVPSVDSRRAVPAEPIVQRSVPTFPDTDPDGIPVMPRDEGEAEGEGDQASIITRAEGIPVTVDLEKPGDQDEHPRKEPDEEPSVPLAAPVLLPDAILPPGVTPPADNSAPGQPRPKPPADRTEPAEPPASPAPTVITPVYHADGGIPIDVPPPPAAGAPAAPPSGTTGTIGKRKALFIAGGIAAAFIVLAGAFAVIGSSGDSGSAKQAGGTASPAATPSATAAAPPPPVVDISNEKTDPKPLKVPDVFPAQNVNVGGRPFDRIRYSLNIDFSYVASGAMVRALTREHCRRVVRVTYLDKGRSLAVTTGVAVMPDQAAAARLSKAGRPSQYEWFRGMTGRNAEDIDRAGGYAVSTTRGRYLIYAYAQYANGKQAKPADPTLRAAAQQFVDLGVRPIEARTR